MITHKKIAELAGVSRSTVTKALSASAEISEETREQIVKIAIETGYFKNKNQRKLNYSKYRSVNIALICPEIISTYYSMNLTAIKNEIEARGGTTYIYISNYNAASITNIIKQFTLNGFIDGIVIFDSSYDSNCPLPIVGITAKDTLPFDTVGISSKKLWCDAIAYLKSKGHTKIGCVGEHYTRKIYEEFAMAMKHNNLEVKNEFIYNSEKRFEEIGYNAAEIIQKQKNRPTAVVAAYSEIGIGLIHKLTYFGISVPDEISIITKNNSPACEYAKVPLTTFELYHNKLAKTAVNMLYDRIFKTAGTVKHHIFNYKLIERNSVKDINKQKGCSD